jgi:hypothetical protein
MLLSNQCNEQFQEARIERILRRNDCKPPEGLYFRAYCALVERDVPFPSALNVDSRTDVSL